jgi:UPF0176 protein
MNHQFKILLYYKYVPVADPQALRIEQKALCQSLNLKGRILISDEGINGTVAGVEADIDRYIAQTQERSEFSDMEWKISWADEQVFPKLRVVVRDEIVTLGIKKSGQDVQISHKADYIQPEELQSLYDNKEDFLIIDARNKYEADIGQFENALVPPIDNFRDFPTYVQGELSEFKGKTIVTYCTGGVRCEKASAYLREQGFTNVRQLHGGIHEYGEQTNGQHFLGEMFVFDKRLHVPINKTNPITLSKCQYCQTAVTRYVDCVAFGCDGLFICCPECQTTHNSACSAECEKRIIAKIDGGIKTAILT